MSVSHLCFSVSRNLMRNQHPPFGIILTTCTVRICQCLTFFSLLFFFSSSWVIVICIYSITILAQCACFFSLAWSHHIHHSNISPFYQMADGKCETDQMKSESVSTKTRRHWQCVQANAVSRNRQTSNMVHRFEASLTMWAYKVNVISCYVSSTKVERKNTVWFLPVPFFVASFFFLLLVTWYLK